jgi:hypothetical protein
VVLLLIRLRRAQVSEASSRTPQRDEYDLVVCLYVPVAGSVEEMVQRMATGVARGGTLFPVGHRRPIDPATGAATAAAGQVQVAVEATLAASMRIGGS